MQCQCNKSIKYNLLCLIQAKQKEVELNSFIEEGIEMIRNVNNECKCNVSNEFLKELVNDAINDMVNNDKVLMKTTIELNGKNDNKFYYVCINKENINESFKEKEIKNEEKIIETKEEAGSNKNDGGDERECKVKEMMELRKELDMLKRKSKQQEWMNVLHKYNDLKDIAQDILGRIAMKKNITVKELYYEMDINENDEE